MSTADFVVILIFIVVPVLYWYNKSLKPVGVWVRFLYNNGSSQDFPATESFSKKRVTVILRRTGSILSKKVKQDKKTWEMKGLPSEHRVNATKRIRVYYASEDGDATIDLAEKTSAGDPVNQIVLSANANVEAANEAMAADKASGFINNLPYFMMGTMSGIAGWMIIERIFPGLGI